MMLGNVNEMYHHDLLYLLTTKICLFLPCPCSLNTVIILWTLNLRDEPIRGSKYCQNKKYQVFLVNFGQPVYKETKPLNF